MASAGYIGSAIDVTELKLASVALSGLSRQAVAIARGGARPDRHESSTRISATADDGAHVATAQR